MEKSENLPALCSFYAVAFAENLVLKDLAEIYPDSKRSMHELRFEPAHGGSVFLFPFGAMVFLNVDPETREQELSRLRKHQPALSSPTVISEEFSVRANPNQPPQVVDGALLLDRMTEARASIIALIVAQSAAMEYYERTLVDMFEETSRLVLRLERHGTTAWKTRPLHRFIGSALVTRQEVLSVLHLLDKPDEAWDDPDIDRIYDRLRAEFDLSDRYRALEIKLTSIQESLELVLDAVRDRRLVALEVAIVLLIVFEIVLSLVRH
jgi:required for meiotic nuclear division protein 1